MQGFSAPFTIGNATQAEIADVLPMVDALYAIEKASGMAYPLRPDFLKVWEDDARRRLGTPNFYLLVARDTVGQVAGFQTGQIRRRPAIYADAFVGSLTEIFVADAARGHGLGPRLIAAALEWFREKGVPMVEGQVIVGNLPPRQMYEKLGWTHEIVQFRKDLR